MQSTYSAPNNGFVFDAVQDELLRAKFYEVYPDKDLDTFWDMRRLSFLFQYKSAWDDIKVQNWLDLHSQIEVLSACRERAAKKGPEFLQLFDTVFRKANANDFVMMAICHAISCEAWDKEHHGTKLEDLSVPDQLVFTLSYLGMCSPENLLAWLKSHPERELCNACYHYIIYYYPWLKNYFYEIWEILSYFIQTAEALSAKANRSDLVFDSLKWITVNNEGDDKGQHVLIETETNEIFGGKEEISAALEEADEPPRSDWSEIDGDRPKQTQTRIAHSQREAQNQRVQRKLSIECSINLNLQAIRQYKSNREQSLSSILLHHSNDSFESIAANFNTRQISLKTATVYRVRPNHNESPLLYYYWEQERKDFQALTNPDWQPEVFLDREQLPKNLADADKADQYEQGFYNLARKVHAFRAILRHSVISGQPLSPTQMLLGLKWEYEYRRACVSLSIAKGKNFALSLTGAAVLLGKELLDKANQNSADSDRVGRELLIEFKTKDTPPSLLGHIGGAHLSPRATTIQRKLDNASLYFKSQLSFADLINGVGRAKNIAFNNLYNAYFLRYALRFANNNVKAEWQDTIDELCEQAVLLYRERHDNAPMAVCLNRDMAAIIHRQKKYDEPAFIPDTVAGQPSCRHSLGHEQAEGMSKEQAYRQANIHFNSGLRLKLSEINNLNRHFDYENYDPYCHNCQGSVVADELRYRGFDVIARANLRNDKNNIFDLSNHPNLIWYDPIIGTAPDMIPLSSVDQIEKIAAEGERYNLVLYAPGIGHVLSFKKLNGRVIVWDPQSGRNGSVKTFFNTTILKRTLSYCNLAYYQISNCEIFGYYADRVVKKPKPTPTLDARRIFSCLNR